MNVTVVACADEPHIEVDGVIGVSGLCASPTLLANEELDADQVVLILHESRYDLSYIQTALRSVGIDPLGTQILDADRMANSSELSLALQGLTARAAAYAGSEPEHAKPVLQGAVTRRGLFRPPRPVYLAAPMIDAEVCAAADGCRACVEACPQDAYRWHHGRIHFNKDVCEPCGRCVATCPTEAITNPAVTPDMLEAQINTLIDQSSTPIGVRLVCSRADHLTKAAGWQDVAVVCSGMVPGSWLISILLMGAAAVSLESCTSGGCPLGLDTHSETAVAFARVALESAGLDAEQVHTNALGDPASPPIAHLDLEAPFTRAGEIATMLGLNGLAAEPLRFTHEGASQGIVTIDADACTLCTQCAQTCPTGAIEANYDGSVVALSFAPASCTNCRQCTIACPEIEQNAIAVSSTVDASLIASGRFTINQGTVLLCESCQKPIAPSSMMDRIGELLGDGFDSTMSYLTSRCLDCRGTT